MTGYKTIGLPSYVVGKKLCFSTSAKQVCALTELRSNSNTEEPKNDIIGPPDKTTNLRPIKFHVPESESIVQKEFRLYREEVQQWNKTFWFKHNVAFIKECEEYRQMKLESSVEQKSLSAEEMSDFYKAFLDKNWKSHVSYNFEWYGKNFKLVLQALRVKMSALVDKDR